MSENIVILSGSPRMKGNTDILVATFTEGAESAGKKVTLFRVADMKIGGCLGCKYCVENKGVCAQKDDMLQILDALRKADALVFASPVYYFNVSAQLKPAIDRQYALVNDKTPIKRTALLMTCADDTSDTAGGAVAMYKINADYENWDNAGIIIVTGVSGKNDIDGRSELDDANKLGREI